MARNREKNRDKVKEVRREERLNSRNEFSISDPTPKLAVDNIISKRRSEHYVF